MLRSLSLVLSILLCAANSSAQAPKKPNSAEIYESIKKLNVLGSVLYVAAHPDDENTNLISFFSNEKHFETRYLSMTRGDGGQNLIGPEIRELLGVLRTEELLAARRIDGGKQAFTRANDFGYSKTPDETLAFWEKDAVLADVVWAIRKYQPDVIFNRFSHTTERPNHGHHTASAQLALAAFDLAANPKAYPEQLKYVKPWQPKRQFLNISWWFYGGREAFAKVDKSQFINMDIGVYYPFKGKSNLEIAAESRSQHRCQAMGTMPERGTYPEYFEYLKGDGKPTSNELFEGINTTWTRLEGGTPIGDILNNVEKNYNFNNPSASVTQLLIAYKLIEALPDSYWKNIKLEEIKQVISKCMGLYIEAVAADYTAVPDENIGLVIEATNRSNTPITLKTIKFLPEGKDTTLNLKLDYNISNKIKTTIHIPKDVSMSNPYWLNEPAKVGMYQVKDQQQIGLPETPRNIRVQIQLLIEDQLLDYPIDVVYKWEDPARGETYRPFEITPPVFANIAETAYIFADNNAKKVSVKLKAGKQNLSGSATLELPQGWKILEPTVQDFSIRQKNEELTLQFNVQPPNNTNEGYLKAIINVDGDIYDKEVNIIKYDHIPIQTVLREAKAKVVRLDLQKKGQKIAYIMGAGDEVPVCLRQIGYDVDLLTAKDVTLENLQHYDALILGIRAYNTQEWLKFAQPKIYEYTQNGGTVIVQYNTNYDIFLDTLTPYPMKISRDRVTDEASEMRFLKPAHKVLNSPNIITAKDFEGWTQERGIYFANDWDNHFEPILSCNDANETAKDGGLLIAPYGKGYYIYTGFVWFRQLPAGVAGAYRLFTNMISIGK